MKLVLKSSLRPLFPNCNYFEKYLKIFINRECLYLNNRYLLDFSLLISGSIFEYFFIVIRYHIIVVIFIYGVIIAFLDLILVLLVVDNFFNMVFFLSCCYLCNLLQNHSAPLFLFCDSLVGIHPQINIHLEQLHSMK